MKRDFRLYILYFLILNFASVMAQVVYTIQNPEAHSGKLFWVPVDGDKVLVKVIDSSNSPKIIQQSDGKLAPNFEYTLPSFYQGQKPIPNGLFHFFQDKDTKLNSEYVLRFYPKSERTFIWSKRYSDYYGYSNLWHRVYDPKGKDPHPFNFKLQDPAGQVTDLETIKAGAGGGAAAGAPGAGAPKVVPGMISGFEWAGESGGWILAKPKNCTDVNHIRRRGEKGIFKYVTGLDENEFEGKSQGDKLKVFEGTRVESDNKVNCGTVGPKKFKCGTINFYKVEDLIKEEGFSSSGKRPSFNIIYYHMSNMKEAGKPNNFTGQRNFRSFADVGALQARPENKDAVFQLASRPNCLEGGRVYRGQDFAEIMGTFAVQGEEAASSAFPGGFARMFVEIPKIAKDDKNNRAINIFKHTNLRQYVTPGGDISGYDVSKLDNTKDWENNLLICFHEGIAVTTGFTCVHRPGDLRRDVPFFPQKDTQIDYNSANCNEKVDDPNDQLINQVPVCALNLKHLNPVDEPHKKYSQQLLKAFYTGTILSAVKHGKYKIFLTMVGGSAFKNDISWIVEAITAQEEYIKKYGLTVYVVFMDWPNNSAAATSRRPLYDMVKRIGGNTLELKIQEISPNQGNELVEWHFYKDGSETNFAQQELASLANNPEAFDALVFSEILKNPLQFEMPLINETSFSLAGESLSAGIDTRDSKFGNTRLYDSVAEDKIKDVAYLLGRGADTNIPNIVGATPLAFAVSQRNNKIVKMLLSAGANVNSADDEGNTPLHNAVSTGRLENVKTLLDAGANKTLRNKDRKTPLDVVQQSVAYEEIIKLLGGVPAKPQPVGQPQPPSPGAQPGAAGGPAKSQLQPKLAQLKTNLVALKDKLGQLSGKLGQLKGKLGQGRPADPGAGKGAGVLATKDIVEKIFAEAKKKVGDVPNVSAVLVENAGNKYNFDTKMQSIVHLNWLKMNYKKNLSERYKGLLGLTQEGGPEKDLTLDEIIQTIAEKNDEFVKVAQNVLAKETENKDDYFVFYHSCQCGPIVVLFEIYQFLYSWGMMKNNQPLAFRFFDINMEEKKDNVIKNFNILKENTKKIEFIGEDTYLNKYSYKYKDDTGKEYKEKGASVDMIEPFVNFLLSVNLAFFGNYGREVEQTFHYFKEGGSITPIAVDRAQKILQPISERLKIPSFNDKMTRIINEFIDLPEVNEKNALGNLVKKGALFQIFIKKNEVDQVAYWTLDGGFIPEYTYYTKDFELLSIGMLPRSPTTPEEKEKSFKLKLSPFVEKISSLLAMYLNKPDELNERVKVYFQNRHQGDAYFLDLDKLQARIWLASPYLYNPEYTKIFRYSLIDKKVFDDLHKKLTKAFDELIKEFIAKKVAGEKFENLPKAFKKLNEFIDEKIKDIKAKGQLAYNCFCDTAAA